jgi:RNA polymerase sigma-70 factor, ECF subfamily
MAASEGEAAPVDTSDESLVRAVCAGDRRAFNLLYERYFPRVYRFVAKRLRNRADTEETVQEVFVNVFSSVHAFRGEAPFAAWVFGLTRRTIAARFKRKRHETVPLTQDEEESLPFRAGGAQRHDDPLACYECSERLDRMDDAVRRELTPEQWQLFRLHHLEDRSIKEIARSTARSEDSVKSHLYRARRVLLAR